MKYYGGNIMNYYTVGKIVNTHGIRGEVRVLSVTDFPDERFKVGNKLYINKNNNLEELTIKTHRKHKQFEMLSFEGLDNINFVEPLKGLELKISESQQGNLDDGSFYHHQIVGLEVYTIDGDYIGKISEIMAPGANDVWVVERDGKDDLLLPAIKDVIKSVQLNEQRVIVELLDGLDE